MVASSVKRKLLPESPIGKTNGVTDITNAVNGTRNESDGVLNEQEKIFIKSLLDDFIRNTLDEYHLKTPYQSNFSTSVNSPKEKNIILFRLSDIIITIFTSIYFRGISLKESGKANKGDSLKINEKLCRDIFRNNPLGKFLDRISKGLGLKYSQIIDVEKKDKDGTDIYFTQEEKENLESIFIQKVKSVIGFLKTILGDDISNSLDISNIFNFKNASILTELYLREGIENIIDKEILLNIIKIITYNNFIEKLLCSISKDSIEKGVLILGINPTVKSEEDFSNFIKDKDLLYSFFIIIEYLISLKDANSQIIGDETSLNIYVLEKIIGTKISKGAYKRYQDSNIKKSINGIENRNSRNFLLKIFFSNMNIFSRGYEFINEKLFGLLVLVEEKRFDGILKLFEKGLSVEQIEFIIENSLEDFINTLSKENIDFLFRLIGLGVKIENIKNLGDEELFFLRNSEINSQEDFNILYYLIINNRENYKNVILNLSLRKNLLNDLEKLDEKTPGYQELDEISKRKDFLELDNEELKAEIRGVYERCGITNVLKRGLEINNKSSIQGREQYCENDELKELIDSLELDENVLRIVYDIFNLLDENTREDFVFWLANNIELEKLKKILEILSILKELNINIFSIGNIPYDYINRFSKIDLSNFTDVEAILSNLSNIDLDYLRQTLSIVKENKINGEINKHISIYLYTLDRKPLDEYIKECLRAKEIAKHTQELDIYTSEIINSGNEDQINKLGQKIEKMMENIFRRFHPEDLTSTKKDNNFGKGSGGISRSIRGLVLQKLKKRNTESYLEYLLRIRIVNLKGLIQLDISESGRSKETLLIRQKIASEDIGFFRFLEILGDEIITHMEQGKGADLDNLVKHFNSVVSEETSKLKKSLNI